LDKNSIASSIFVGFVKRVFAIKRPDYKPYLNPWAYAFIVTRKTNTNTIPIFFHMLPFPFYPSIYLVLRLLSFDNFGGNPNYQIP